MKYELLIEFEPSRVLSRKDDEAIRQGVINALTMALSAVGALSAGIKVTIRESDDKRGA